MSDAEGLRGSTLVFTMRAMVRLDLYGVQRWTELEMEEGRKEESRKEGKEGGREPTHGRK